MRAYLSIALILAFPLALEAGEPKVAPKVPPKGWDKAMDEKDRRNEIEVMKVTDRKLRAQRHYQTAKRLYEDLMYAEARKEAELAVTYDPSNRKAKELLRLANSVLAVRRARIRTMTQHLERREQIKRQEQLMKLQNHVDRAKVLLARATAGKRVGDDVSQLAEEQKQLDEADRQLVRAREIAKWMPAYVPVKEFEETIETMLAQVYKERKARDVKLKALGQERAAGEALRARARQLEFQRRRVRMLMDKAMMLFAREDYDGAGRLSRRVLEMDPTNSRAVELGTACRIKAIDKRAARTADLKKEAIKDWIELSKRATIPHSRLLVYPKDWDEISRRESLEEKRLQEPEWKRNIRAALEKEVSLEFEEQPLEECINYLRGLTEANIITDNKAFVGGGVNPKTPITLRLSKTKLGLALKWILRMAKLDYAMKKGAIFISTPKNLQGELIQKIYDVRDLTFTITSFPGPELGLGAGGGGGGGGGGGPAVVVTPPPTVIAAPGTLQDMIKRVIRPTTWGAGGGAAIEERNGQLIVVHQPEVHAQISQLLEDFRKSQTIQVHVEARYVDVSQGFLEEIGVDWGGNPSVGGWFQVPDPNTGSTDDFNPNHPSTPGEPGVWDSSFGLPGGRSGRLSQMYSSWNTGRGTTSALGGDYLGPGEGLSALFAYLGNWQAQWLIRAIKKEQRGTVLFAPRLTMFNNQRAHIFVGRQTSYISGWTSSGDVSTPEVSTAIMDGVSLDVRPIVSHDRRYITLELRPTLVRPVRERNFAVDDDDDDDDDDDVGTLRFTLPELEIRTIRTVVTVPDGGTVLLSGLMTESTSDQHQGIPGLMNIPFLGRLFGNNYKDVERRNLLILVNARLILFSEEELKL